MDGDIRGNNELQIFSSLGKTVWMLLGQKKERKVDPSYNSQKSGSPVLLYFAMVNLNL